MLETTWTDCPNEVKDEVRRLWQDFEYGNDTYYFAWESDEELVKKYPHVAAYLKEREVTDCLIHYWW